MRIVYPVLAVLAYIHFLVALLAGFLLVALVPLLVIGFMALLVAGRQFGPIVRLTGSLVRLTIGSLGVAAGLLRELWLALFERDEEPIRVPFAYGREALPELFRLVDEVAGEMRTRGVDRVLVTPEPRFGVFDVAAPGRLSSLRRRRRHLVVGLPFLYALSLDELRAVLAHELGHFTLGHVSLSRITWHFIRRIGGRLDAMREAEFHVLNPVFWSTRASLAVFEAIYLPWSRLQELDADRKGARASGGNHAISALRKSREEVPAVAAAMEAVASVARSQQVAPRHLGEAAARLAWRLPPAAKRQLAREREGDPFDLDGRTHPPTAHRIAALNGVPHRPPRHGEIAAKYLPDVRKLEEHVTRALLRIEAIEASKEHAERVVASLSTTTTSA